MHLSLKQAQAIVGRARAHAETRHSLSRTGEPDVIDQDRE